MPKYIKLKQLIEILLTYQDDPEDYELDELCIGCIGKGGTLSIYGIHNNEDGEVTDIRVSHTKFTLP